MSSDIGARYLSAAAAASIVYAIGANEWAFIHFFQYVFPAIALLTGIGISGIARKGDRQ